MPYSKNNSINWSEVFYETPNWDPQIIEPLRDLQTEISTEKLIDPKKIGAPFEYKNISKNGDYYLYTYKVQKGGKPWAIKDKIIKAYWETYQILLPKNEIQITNEYVDEYPSQKMLEKNTEVRVRVPISKTKNSLTGKLPKIDQNIFGNFTYKGLTKDNQYHKYQYKPSKECTPQSIKEDFLDKNKEYYQSLGITLQAQNIQIVKGNTDPYDDKQTLSVNQDVRIRINPKMIEDDSEKGARDKFVERWSSKFVAIYERSSAFIENLFDSSEKKFVMKKKWKDYFGMDISKFNTNLDLNKFKEWNRKERDDEASNRRGVSFCYIRASDGIKADDAFEKNLNFISQYNQDSTVKENNETIAVGLYHRFNLSDPKKQAEAFLKQYDLYNEKDLGWNKCFPVIDIEDNYNGSIENILERLKIIEEKTGKQPGIYASAVKYNALCTKNKDIGKYKKRIAAYTESRINKDGQVNISPNKDGKKYIDVDITQRSAIENIPGTGNNQHQTDFNTAKEVPTE